MTNNISSISHEANPETNDRVLIINASTRLSSYVNAGSGSYAPRTEDSGDVQTLFRYLSVFLFRPVDLAGCDLSKNNNDPQALIDLLRTLPNQKVLIVVDEVDSHDVNFVRTARHIADAIGEDAKHDRRQFVFVPAIASLNSHRCGETTFSMGAAYQQLLQGDLGSGIHIGSRNTFGNPNDDFYSRETGKIASLGFQHRNTIHVVAKGGTIDGFAGDYAGPPPKEITYVGELMRSLSTDDHPLRYQIHKLDPKDGRALNGNDMREIADTLVGISDEWEYRGKNTQPDESAKQEPPAVDLQEPRIIVTLGTYALADVGRFISTFGVPIALVGSWLPINTPYSDAGFNLGQAAAFLTRDELRRTERFGDMSAIILNGHVTPASYAEKDGQPQGNSETPSMYDRRDGWQAVSRDRVRIVHDPYAPQPA